MGRDEVLVAGVDALSEVEEEEEEVLASGTTRCCRVGSSRALGGLAWASFSWISSRSRAFR